MTKFYCVVAFLLFYFFTFYFFYIFGNICIAAPNGHTTWNPRLFDVDITSICRRLNFDDFPCHFRVLFQCNFYVRKIQVFSTYFYRCNFAGWKFHAVSTYFFGCNFKICTLLLLTFFDVILIGKNSTSFLVSCKPMKTFEKIFPEFATLNSWLLQDCSL